jgi:hypothetical protein
MKLKNLALVFAVAAAIMVAGCGADVPTSDQVQNAKTEQLNQEAVKQVGMPGINNFTEKKLFRKLYELRDDNIATFAYTQDMSGHLHFICNSLGYGLPYSTQFTNPQAEHWTPGGTFYQTPQSEPNGLFMPSDAEGTWVICGSKTKPDDIEPVYVEPRVIVSPFKLNAVDSLQADKDSK